MKRAVEGFLAGLLILSGSLVCRAAEPAAPTKSGEPVVVLDAVSVWRIHEALKRPVIQFDDAVRPITTIREWLDRETAIAPADWMKSGFDDRSWLRGGARASSRTPYLADLCLRAEFEVTEATQVRNL